MNRQEIFDKVAKHLLTQNARSEDGESCLYRSEDGLMCAVGCLIKDEHYSVALENQSVSHESVNHALNLSGVETDSVTTEMLEDLQTLHDGIHPLRYDERIMSIDEWSLGLSYIAATYNLNTDGIK